MKKVKITREQADRINVWKTVMGDMSRLLELQAKGLLVKSKSLQELSLDELARAIYVGYEVEEEFSKGDWVVVTFELHTTIYGKIKKITDVKDSLAAGHDVYFNLEGDGVVYQNEIRHATESEIVQEEARRMDKKLDKLLLELSNDERINLYKN